MDDANVPFCSLQQQAQYGGFNARCGQLTVTRGDNGKQSIDAVTVTIGGKAPKQVIAGSTATGVFGSIQSAIDAADPGDLIIVNPGVYNELLLMWKPVRLQGVGAASSVINANTQPAGKLNPWRAKVNCLFGLALNGQPMSSGSDVPNPGGAGFEPKNLYDPTNTYTCGSTGGTGWADYHGGDNNPEVDRLPLDAVVGWDTTLNGNLAQLLQEPSLMGAYEGAGITVLAKGVRYPKGVEVFGTGPDTTAGSNIAHEGQMPLGTVLLTNSNAEFQAPTVVAQSASPKKESTAVPAAVTRGPVYTSTSTLYHPDRFAGRAGKYYTLVWGVDSLSVRAVEAGELIRFSFEVLDPVKATPLNDKKVEPKLVAPAANAILVIPLLEKVGQLRQSSTPEAGKSYWMAFSNPNRTVKRGDRVNVVIGQFHAEGLVVE